MEEKLHRRVENLPCVRDGHAAWQHHNRRERPLAIRHGDVHVQPHTAQIAVNHVQMNLGRPPTVNGRFFRQRAGRLRPWLLLRDGIKLGDGPATGFDRPRLRLQSTRRIDCDGRITSTVCTPSPTRPRAQPLPELTGSFESSFHPSPCGRRSMVNQANAVFSNVNQAQTTIDSTTERPPQPHGQFGPGTHFARLQPPTEPSIAATSLSRWLRAASRSQNEHFFSAMPRFNRSRPLPESRHRLPLRRRAPWEKMAAHPKRTER